jgi:hypothetical protein
MPCATEIIDGNYEFPHSLRNVALKVSWKPYVQML